MRAANKRTLEGIAIAGGFDLFGLYRSQYFETIKEQTYIEQMIKFGNKVKDKQNSNQVDMFGDTEEASLKAPIASNANPWTNMKILSKEKEVVGIYISGHPLDDYKFEIDNFCNAELSALRNIDAILGKHLSKILCKFIFVVFFNCFENFCQLSTRSSSDHTVFNFLLLFVLSSTSTALNS